MNGIDSQGTVRTGTTDANGNYTVGFGPGPGIIHVIAGTALSGSVLTTGNNPQHIVVTSSGATPGAVGFQVQEIVVSAEPVFNAGNPDTLFGGTGNDKLWGGGGNDYMTGGHWLGPFGAGTGQPYDAHVLVGVDCRPNIDPASIPVLGSITGVVKDSVGNLLAGVKVSVLYKDAALHTVEGGSTLTNAAGKYVFANVLAGDYILRILPPGAYDIEPVKGIDPATGNPQPGNPIVKVDATNGRSTQFHVSSAQNFVAPDVVLVPVPPSAFQFQQS